MTDDSDDLVDDVRRGYLSAAPGLILLAWVPAALLVLGAIVVAFTEDASAFRIAATAGGGIAMSLALHGLIVAVARSMRAPVVRRPGATRPGNPRAWLLLAGVGMVPTVAGFVLAEREWDFSRSAVRTESVVVSTERTGSQNDSGTRGRVRFTTADGRAVEAMLDPLPTRDLDGRSIDVRYDPADPTQVRPANPMVTWSPIVLLLGLGGLMVVGCLVGALRRGAFRRS